MAPDASGARVYRVAARAFTIPTDAPESDGTLAWASTTLVLVDAEAGGCCAVIDSSYALACLLPDESSPETMNAVHGELLVAPFIWPIEIASAMRNNVRRHRLRRTEAESLSRAVTGLGTKIIAPWHDDPERYLAVALAYDLTPYEAIYIDLCLAERAALATRDAALALAASRVGIRIHA